MRKINYYFFILLKTESEKIVLKYKWSYHLYGKKHFAHNLSHRQTSSSYDFLKHTQILPWTKIWVYEYQLKSRLPAQSFVDHTLIDFFFPHTTLWLCGQVLTRFSSLNLLLAQHLLKQIKIISARNSGDTTILSLI